MANGIFVIQKTSDGVVAINAERFNPEIHTKLASPHGDPWGIENPPVVPARDEVSEEGSTKPASKNKPAQDESEEKEEPKTPAKKKGPAKGKK